MDNEDHDDIITVVTLGMVTAIVAMMASKVPEVCGMLLAGAVCLIGVGIITLFWTKVEYKNQLPDWKKYLKQ